MICTAGWKVGSTKPLGDLPREFRAVLVDDADREIGRLGDGAGRHRVDGDAEGVDDKDQHRRVSPDASQLLDDQAEDIDHMIDEASALRFARCAALVRGSLRRRHLTPPACEGTRAIRQEDAARSAAIAAMLRQSSDMPSALAKTPTVTG